MQLGATSAEVQPAKRSTVAILKSPGGLTVAEYAGALSVESAGLLFSAARRRASSFASLQCRGGRRLAEHRPSRSRCRIASATSALASRAPSRRRGCAPPLPPCAPPLSADRAGTRGTCSSSGLSCRTSNTSPANATQ